jgi:DNA-binding response OmpR family regulator
VAEANKILVVEDDLDLAEMLNAYFRTQGYQVRISNWGEDAVKSATQDVPDVVVLDVRLPDINGFEVCRRLRQSRHTESVPVIFLTEKREREDKLMGLELGAVDYITKPFDIQELRLRVRNIIRRADMDAMVNPVTNLPEGAPVQENLEKMLRQPDWGLVVARIQGLDRFRDRYGFVAADDVARAISLMITNALQESDSADNFVGHIGPVDFIIVTTAERQTQVMNSCRIRLESSIQYFYPAIDRVRLHEIPASERLHVKVVGLSSREADLSDWQGLQMALAKV